MCLAACRLPSQEGRLIKKEFDTVTGTILARFKFFQSWKTQGTMQEMSDASNTFQIKLCFLNEFGKPL